MKKIENRLVVYCLTRGYRGLDYWKYIRIIRRNLSLRNIKDEIDQVKIFHEGNIGKMTQRLIGIFSKTKLVFEDVSADFKVQVSLALITLLCANFITFTFGNT